MNTVIIKYNAGNICSVDYALKRLGIDALITDDKEKILSADKVIFPGVGEAETTMNFLREAGMVQLIKDFPHFFSEKPKPERIALAFCSGL